MPPVICSRFLSLCFVDYTTKMHAAARCRSCTRTSLCDADSFHWVITGPAHRGLQTTGRRSHPRLKHLHPQYQQPGMLRLALVTAATAAVTARPANVTLDACVHATKNCEISKTSNLANRDHPGNGSCSVLATVGATWHLRLSRRAHSPLVALSTQRLPTTTSPLQKTSRPACTSCPAGRWKATSATPPPRDASKVSHRVKRCAPSLLSPFSYCCLRILTCCFRR